MIVSFRLPKISLGAFSNLVGFVGLVAVALAVGGLTGNWWWSVLAGGGFAVALAVLAGLAQEESRADVKPLKHAAGRSA